MTEPYLSVSLTATIVTDEDSCGSGRASELTVEMTDAGGGWYPVIKTERFATDTPAQLAAIVAAVVAAQAELERQVRTILYEEQAHGN
jgi:hypothetical protein